MKSSSPYLEFLAPIHTQHRVPDLFLLLHFVLASSTYRTNTLRRTALRLFFQGEKMPHAALKGPFLESEESVQH